MGTQCCQEPLKSLSFCLICAFTCIILNKVQFLSRNDYFQEIWTSFYRWVVHTHTVNKNIPEEALKQLTFFTPLVIKGPFYSHPFSTLKPLYAWRGILWYASEWWIFRMRRPKKFVLYITIGMKPVNLEDTVRKLVFVGKLLLWLNHQCDSCVGVCENSQR